MIFNEPTSFCGENKNINSKTYPTVEDLMNCLEKLKNQWIPCSVRLPKDDEMVLVTCETKKGTRNVNRAYHSGGFWHGSGSMSGVIAWMPLPEPYCADVEKPQTDADLIRSL